MKRLLLFLMLAGLLSSAGAQPSYTFGVVPQFEPRKLAGIWTPVLRDLEKRTGFKLELVGSPRIPQFEAEFEQGSYDFAYMNPYHALVAGRLQKYIPLVRDGSRQLYGILVVAKDSPIASIADLNGKTVAFPSPNALGASLLMRADLERLHKISVVPLWAQTHTSSYLSVALGSAQAAGGVMSTFQSQKPELRDRLKILYETRRMPPHPVVAHPRVPEADREKMRQAFLDMAADPQGAALLANVPIGRAVAASANDYQQLARWGLEDFYVKDAQ